MHRDIYLKAAKSNFIIILLNLNIIIILFSHDRSWSNLNTVIYYYKHLVIIIFLEKIKKEPCF